MHRPSVLELLHYNNVVFPFPLLLRLYTHTVHGV